MSTISDHLSHVRSLNTSFSYLSRAVGWKRPEPLRENTQELLNWLVYMRELKEETQQVPLENDFQEEIELILDRAIEKLEKVAPYLNSDTEYLEQLTMTLGWIRFVHLPDDYQSFDFAGDVCYRGKTVAEAKASAQKLIDHMSNVTVPEEEEAGLQTFYEEKLSHARYLLNLI